MRDDLIKWLVDNHLADSERGYGHACAEDVADAILRDWNITFKEPK